MPQNSKANYKVEEQGDNLIITTAAMRAVMNEATGQITFYDLKDNVLLNEVAQGGKTFKPFTVPDREIGVILPRFLKHRSTDGHGVRSSTLLITKLSMDSVSTRVKNSI